MRIRSIKPEFWRDEGIVQLPVPTRLTFIGLWSYVDDNGVGDARVSSVVGDLYADDMSRDPTETLRRVSGDLQELSDAGMIVRYTDPDRPRRELLYIVNWKKHQVVNKPSKGNLYPLPPAAIVDAAGRATGPDGDTPETPPPGAGEQRSRGTEEQGKELARPSGPSVSRFDEFWSTYPRKVGKQKARGKYAAAVKRAGDEQTVIDGVVRLATDPNLPEHQFIPHPTTWLERDGWDDEPLPSQQSSPTGSSPSWLDIARAASQPADYIDGEVIEFRELG